MENKKSGFKISSIIMNLAIALLLVVLLFMIYEIFATSKRREAPQPLPLTQEEAVVPPTQKQKIAVALPAPAVIVPSAPIVAPSVTPKFTIQAGSFQDKAKADGVADALKKKGYSPTVETKDLGAKGIWYRVYVGGFAIKEEAQGFLETIKKDNPNAFLKQL